MKIAYLILAHDNPKHLYRLVQSLRHENAVIFIHIDRKSNIEDFAASKIFPEVVFISERVKVYWGGFSMIKATLNLLSAAFSHHRFDCFQLLSNSDYPVKSNAFIMAALTRSNAQHIECMKMPLSHKPLSRLENFTLEGGRNKHGLKAKLIRAINRCLAAFARQHKRNYKKHLGDLQLYGGSQWWILTHACVKYILDFLQKHPSYLKAFHYSFCPDEIFFQTIVMNSPFRTNVKDSLTYADWTRPEYKPQDSPPAEIEEHHLEVIKEKKHILFARKFSARNYHLLDIIDQQLRTAQETATWLED